MISTSGPNVAIAARCPPRRRAQPDQVEPLTVAEDVPTSTGALEHARCQRVSRELDHHHLGMELLRCDRHLVEVVARRRAPEPVEGVLLPARREERREVRMGLDRDRITEVGDTRRMREAWWERWRQHRRRRHWRRGHRRRGRGRRDGRRVGAGRADDVTVVRTGRERAGGRRERHGGEHQ
jgi:hypothetical protein